VVLALSAAAAFAQLAAARGNIPNGQAALRCLYLVAGSLNHAGQGRAR
jgi:hypothetical protein